MIKENLFDFGKLTFFTEEKIVGLIILKINANIETIKTYVLNLQQKLVYLAFFNEDKTNITLSRRFKHKN